MFGKPPDGAWRAPLTLSVRAGTPTRWLGFVGDIMPLMWRGARFSPEVIAFFSDCEAVVGNFEGILSEEAWFPFLQRHTPAIFAHLQQIAPLENWIVSVANNHAPDYGAAGFERTLAFLDERQVRWVGTRARPQIELRPRITLSAWTEWTNGKTTLVPLRDPGAPKGAGLHIAFPHWGYEFERTPRADQRRALPPGYDLIVGHHSHLPQKPELIDGRLVAWSLGNFVTEVKLRTMGEGALLKVGLADASNSAPVVVTAHALPIRLDRSERAFCAVDIAR